MRLAKDGTKQNAPLFNLALSLFILLTFAVLTASNAFASSKAPLNDSVKGLKQEQQDQYVVLISLDGFLTGNVVGFLLKLDQDTFDLIYQTNLCDSEINQSDLHTKFR